MTACTQISARSGRGARQPPPGPSEARSAVAASGPSATAAAAVPDPTTATLRQLARHTKLEIGTAVDTSALPERRDVPGSWSPAQFSTVTPENVMKWEVVEPHAGRVRLRPGRPLVAFARAHGQKVRGHTLVWHNQLPAWLTSGTWTRDAAASHPARAHLRPWSGTSAARSGPWDVVNEAFNDDGTLRDTIWLQHARSGLHRRRVPLGAPGRPEGDAVLQRLQHRGHQPEEHAVYDLLKQLRARGRPGRRRRRAGPPGHPVRRSRRTSCRTCGGSRRSGWTRAITEADVRHDLPVDAGRGATPRPTGYSLMLESCLLVPSVHLVHGLGLHRQVPVGARDVPRRGRGAIFDENYNPKPAYNALRRDLALAP